MLKVSDANLEPPKRVAAEQAQLQAQVRVPLEAVRQEDVTRADHLSHGILFRSFSSLFFDVQTK